MRIALTIEKLGRRFGGAERYAAGLAAALHESGHAVTCVCRLIDPTGLPAGVRTERVDVGPLGRIKWLRAWRFAAGSARAIEAGGFDLSVGFNKTWRQDVLVAVAGAHPATVAHNRARFRSPLRRVVYSMGKALNPPQMPFRAIDRRTFGPAGTRPRIVAPSRFVAGHFETIRGVPTDRISVVPNGLPLPDSQPGPAEAARNRATFRADHDIPATAPVALLLARNYRLKGLEPLLLAWRDVLARVPAAALIVGGSEKDAAFRRQARRLDIAHAVRFCGRVEDIDAAYAAADVLAFPTFYDPGSLVVPEAQWHGLPVVTTTQNGAAELLTEGVDGFIVPFPWDTATLADRLARVLSDGPLRARMSRAARAAAPRHALEQRTAELLAAITGDHTPQHTLRRAA